MCQSAKFRRFLTVPCVNAHGFPRGYRRTNLRSRKREARELVTGGGDKILNVATVVKGGEYLFVHRHELSPHIELSYLVAQNIMRSRHFEAFFAGPGKIAQVSRRPKWHTSKYRTRLKLRKCHCITSSCSRRCKSLCIARRGNSGALSFKPCQLCGLTKHGTQSCKT